MGGFGRGMGGGAASNVNETIAQQVARLLCEAQPIHEIGKRARVSRPMTGVYPLRPTASGWVAATGPVTMGMGGSQFLGVFDTRPELAPYDDDLDKALQPVGMVGGATFRASVPRATEYADGGVANSSIAPAQAYACALLLYVAGVDVLPEGWRERDDWPGLPTGDAGYIQGASDLRTRLALGLTGPVVGFGADPAGLTDAPGQFVADGRRYLARHVARPMLDVLAYTGAPTIEADLVELAGGCRYVGAWLRFVYPRWSDVDPFTAIDLDIPWAVVPGGSRYACHRSVWHTAVPVVGTAMTIGTWETDILTPGTGARYGVCSPIAGNWQARICSNAEAVDAGASLLIGLETRGSDRIEVDSTAVDYNEHSAAISPSIRHGGSAVVIAGYDSTKRQTAGLVSLSVTP